MFRCLRRNFSARARKLKTLKIKKRRTTAVGITYSYSDVDKNYPLCLLSVTSIQELVSNRGVVPPDWNKRTDIYSKPTIWHDRYSQRKFGEKKSDPCLWLRQDRKSRMFPKGAVEDFTQLATRHDSTSIYVRAVDSARDYTIQVHAHTHTHTNCHYVRVSHYKRLMIRTAMADTTVKNDLKLFTGVRGMYRRFPNSFLWRWRGSRRLANHGLLYLARNLDHVITVTVHFHCGWGKFKLDNKILVSFRPLNWN